MAIIHFLTSLLEYLMTFCYAATGNYWIAILLFTLLTKIILMPLSLWCQKNALIMLRISPTSNRIKVKYFGDSDRIAEETHALFKKEHYHPLLTLLPLAVQIIILMGLVEVIRKITGSENGASLGLIPIRDSGFAWLMPLLAGGSAFLLGYAQNRLNPLQREQGRWEQMTTNGISIAISLSLGCFVAGGVVLYWIASNIFAILVQIACNMIIPPRSVVNYIALKRSKMELEALKAVGKGEISKEEKKREKQDYKRFFSILNKHFVIYSESSGFYKYFQSLIDYLLTHSNLTIHYVTNDPNDQVFEIAKQLPKLKPYFIGQKRIIPLMMKMDADMVLMTTPDLDKFYIKRSYVRKDIEYVYTCHGLTSTHLCVREGAYDNFDTVFCTGQHQIDELRAAENIYRTKEKNLIQCGYPLLDNLISNFEKTEKKSGSTKKILIAPSYQADNILDTCLDTLLVQLLDSGYCVIVRPHPQYKRRYPARISALIQRYQDKLGENFIIETDFSSNVTIYTADLLITDWSGIAYEFSFTTKRPSIFINTPIKIINKNYQKIGLEPTDITLRDMAGVSFEPENLETLGQTVKEFLEKADQYAEKLEEIRTRYIFNIGESTKVAGEYILNSLKQKAKEKNK